jgi:hypothetical protein
MIHCHQFQFRIRRRKAREKRFGKEKRAMKREEEKQNIKSSKIISKKDGKKILTFSNRSI